MAVAIPMEVDDREVPAATPVSGSYPAATMYPVPSAMGRIVPATAMTTAMGPTRRSEVTSMWRPPP